MLKNGSGYIAVVYLLKLFKLKTLTWCHQMESIRLLHLKAIYTEQVINSTPMYF